MAQEKPSVIRVEYLDRLIYEIRGQKVMLDADLAAVYGVTTKALNQAVKRNSRKFPSDFMFQLNAEDFEAMRSQFVTASNRSQFVTGSEGALRSQIVTSKRRGGRRYLPFAFTEHGAIMAANVLNSPRAVDMSVFVVRAFVKMRATLTATREQARKLAALEKELKDRLDVHEAAIVTILQRVMDIIDLPALPEPPPKKRIGFQVRESRRSYLTRTTPP
ncbi:MAG TPA: ORF6N domain-containing protein [Verrucomicrobiae bacterium]|nr:ORF6N domain-containing protein [Verrucomicrobiae bacterium]